MSRKIILPKMLIVEGTHEVKFFNVLLPRLGLNDIQVEQIGGNTFEPVLDGLRSTTGFSQLESMAILRDADLSCGDMFSSVQHSLRKLGYPVPTRPNEMATVDGTFKTLIYIFPDNQNNGALEDLCLASVADDLTLNCVETYFSCLDGINSNFGSAHPHPKKARVQAFLAREEEGDIHMGIAAQKGVWNWDSPVFDQLKYMLRNL